MHGTARALFRRVMRNGLTITFIFAGLLASPAYGAQDLNLLFGMGEVINLAESEEQTMRTLMRQALVQRGFNVHSANLSGKSDTQLLSTMRG